MQNFRNLFQDENLSFTYSRKWRDESDGSSLKKLVFVENKLQNILTVNRYFNKNKLPMGNFLDRTEINFRKNGWNILKSEIISISGADSVIIITSAFDVHNEEFNQYVTFLFYNEFTVAGQPLKIKGGEYAKGAKVNVLFNDGNGYNLASPKVEVKGSNEIWAVVPEKVANSFPVMIVNGSDSIKTDVLFRDSRNIIVDFDNKKDQLYISGAAEKYTNLFSLNNGDYGVFDDIKSWQAIVYQSSRENAKAADSTVFGVFTNDILNKQLNIREFAIKFEVNVPKEHPIIGEVFEFGFCSGNDEDPIGNIRNCAAYWCPSEYVWIK